jgi:hypothetical protein
VRQDAVPRNTSRPDRRGDLANPLCEFADDSLQAADAAEPVGVLVVLDLADELCPARLQVGEDGLDVVDRECEMADARCVRRRMLVVARVRRRVELDQSSCP